MQNAQTDQLNDSAEASLKTLHALTRAAETVQTLRAASANMTTKRTEFREDEDERSTITDLYDAMALDILEAMSHMTVSLREEWSARLPSKKKTTTKKDPDATA